jgi:diamine N-acetyltransferase
MYRSFGFEETGEMDGEELIAVLRLQLTTSSLRM